MSHVLSVVVLILLSAVCLAPVEGYRCDRSGKCSNTDQCCNTQRFFYSRCCQASAKCCYHRHWTGCCGPLDTCCWGVHFRGIACCPPGFKCCGAGRRRDRAGCCWITPLWIWILLGVCGSIIVVLLLLSLYQCIMEEYDEYQNQRVAGNLPADNSWYYYDYGSTLTSGERGRRSTGYRPSSRQPPEYEPPPSYTPPTSSSNTGAGTTGGSRPKPPTPQSRGRQHDVQQMTPEVGSRGSEYYSAAETGSISSTPLTRTTTRATTRASAVGSVYESVDSDQDEPCTTPNTGNVLQTFYEHSVPKLQRMLCSKGECLVGDGSCVYCMDEIGESQDLEDNPQQTKQKIHQELANPSHIADQQTLIH